MIKSNTIGWHGWHFSNLFCEIGIITIWIGTTKHLQILIIKFKVRRSESSNKNDIKAEQRDNTILCELDRPRDTLFMTLSYTYLYVF